MVSDVFVIDWDLGISGMEKCGIQDKAECKYVIVSEEMGSNCNVFPVGNVTRS